MKLEKFKGELIGGHKDAAIEVPFDPAKLWAIAATRLRPGVLPSELSNSLGRTHTDSFTGLITIIAP
jgi:hypothetical protein